MAAAFGLAAPVPASPPAGPLPPTSPPSPAEPIAGIVLDPSDYDDLGLPPEDLAAQLAARFRRHGVNVIYVNAYNVVHGAHYQTTHPFNVMDRLGEADFIRLLLREAHRRGLRVFAAFYHHVHRGAWMANPDWRARRRDGSAYNPPGVDAQYFLSVWHPEAQAWWLGLLRELLERYPDLDGIELREPVINWWGVEADYNPHAVRAFRAAHPGQPLGGLAWTRWRADGLTAFLRHSIRLVHASGRRVHVTTVMSAWGDGRLLTVGEQAAQTGFDLDGLLAGEDRPEAVKVELIWQQWANVYDYVTFTPEWTGPAARTALARVGDRARTIIHVELTDFGRRVVAPEEIYLALRAARAAGAREFDVYGARLADEKGAWSWLEREFARVEPRPPRRPPAAPARRVLVLEDVDRDRSGEPRLATTLLVNLLGHFDVLVEVRSAERYQPGEVAAFDAVIYQGTVRDAPLSAHLLRDLDAFPATILWIGANLWQLTRGEEISRFGVVQPVPVGQATASAIDIQGRQVAAGAPLPLLGFAAAPAAEVLAAVPDLPVSHPVAVRSGRFWYVGGYLHRPTDGNPLHLLVADILHDVLRGPHPAEPRALLVITGIHPLVDPDHLARLRGVAAALGVRPALAVTPVFVDPVTEVRVELPARPEVVRHLRAMIAEGASIVQSGYTHQFRGRTGVDFEFWDAVSGGPRVDDSEALVRSRVTAGMRLLVRSGLYPLAWSTPGDLASPFDYTQFGRHYAAMVEHRLYGWSAGRPVQQRFPYAVWRDVHGHTVLTPTVRLDARTDAVAARQVAEDLLSVRDALAVVAVSVNTPPESVGDLVKAMRAMGYAFTPLAGLRPLQAEGDRLVIVAGRARLRLELDGGRYLRETDVDAGGRVRARRIRRLEETDRLMLSLTAPDGGLRVVEVLQVHPRSPRALALQVGSAAQAWLDRWAVTAGPARLLLVGRLAVGVLSVMMVLALALTLVGAPLAYLAAALRRRRARRRPRGPA